MRLNTIVEEQLPKEKSEKTLQVLGTICTSHLESDIYIIKPNIFKPILCSWVRAS